MRVGFEAAHLSVSRHHWLESTMAPLSAAELVPVEQLVEGLRVRKDDYEIATLREAARRLSIVAATVVLAVRRAGPSWTSPWPSTGGSVRPGSNARRLIPLWPAPERRPAARQAQWANH